MPLSFLQLLGLIFLRFHVERYFIRLKFCNFAPIPWIIIFILIICREEILYMHLIKSPLASLYSFMGPDLLSSLKSFSN